MVRKIQVVHNVHERVRKGKTEIYLDKHLKWAVLTAATKKVKSTPEETLKELNRELYDSQVPTNLIRIPLQSYTVQAVSPTAGVLTSYTVHPFVTRCNKKLSSAGEWLTRDEALKLTDLSPTVREMILQQPRLPTKPGSKEEAFERFLRKEPSDIKPIINSLKKALQSKYHIQDLDELIYDILIKSFIHREYYIPGMPVISWLKKIGIRLQIDKHRSRLAQEAKMFSVPVAQVRSAQEEASFKEESERLRRALNEVLQQQDPVHRLVWRLFIDEDLSYEEIQQVLEIKPKTIGPIIFNIRRKTKKFLGL